ncbi:MAG: alpha-glucosidase, partial [Spirochaetes bacterium]|nr:alpha-glucosidase [Spirochaetota bacterium]
MIIFNHNSHQFTLEYNGKIFLIHNHANPCVFIGKGTATYRMRYSHFKIHQYVREKKALVSFSVKEISPRIVIEFESLLTLIATEENGLLYLRFRCPNSEINRFWITLVAEPNEGIYGCGEQYTYFNLKGKIVPLFVQEQGVGRGKDLITLLANLKADAGGTWYTTYFNQPTFISSEKYFVHSDESAYAEFDFSKKNYHTLHFWHIPENLIVGCASSLPETVGKVSLLLGRQKPLPEWIYHGAVLGIQGGTDVVDAKLKTALSAGAKISAVWAQDWEGIRMTSFGKRLFWNWQWNKTLYPHLDENINKYKDRGIRFLLSLIHIS